MALLVIVGGGLGGLAVAIEAASGVWNRARGNDVLVLREPDVPLPRSEALRAPSWWHSGLHYARRVDADLDFAAQLGVMTRLAEQRFRLDVQRVPPGVMRIPQRGLARFSLAVQQLGMRSRVRKLEAAEAQRLLGPAYVPGSDGLYFEVPDRPFAEADVLAVLRMHARALGVHLREVESGAGLEVDPHAPCRCRVLAGGRALTPDALVLAAGSDTPGLLEQLGIERSYHQLVVERTTSLVVTKSLFSASLIADYGAGWTATQLERGRYVFTMSGLRKTEAERLSPELSDAPARALRERFELVTRSSIAGHHRFITGLEVRKDGVADPAHARLLVERAPRAFPGVVWTLPGRATLALAAAQLAVALLPRPTRSHTALTPPPGRAWQAPIAMAHSRFYDSPNQEATT